MGFGYVSEACVKHTFVENLLRRQHQQAEEVGDIIHCPPTKNTPQQLDSY